MVEAAYNRIKMAFRGELSARSTKHHQGDERELEDNSLGGGATRREDPITRFKNRLE